MKYAGQIISFCKAQAARSQLLSARKIGKTEECTLVRFFLGWRNPRPARLRTMQFRDTQNPSGAYVHDDASAPFSKDAGEIFADQVHHIYTLSWMHDERNKNAPAERDARGTYLIRQQLE